MAGPIASGRTTPEIGRDRLEWGATHLGRRRQSRIVVAAPRPNPEWLMFARFSIAVNRCERCLYAASSNEIGTSSTSVTGRER